MEEGQSIFALASTWQAIAAVATVVAAVTSIWAVVATFAAPLISARLTARAQRRQLKLWVFGTLMQDRGGILSNDAVRAYNLIDALFHDARDVRDLWGDYYNSLGDTRLDSDEGGRIRQDKRNALLRAMAVDIGLGKYFVSDDFSRVYLPQSLADQQNVEQAERQLRKSFLLDQLRKQQQGDGVPSKDEGS